MRLRDALVDLGYFLLTLILVTYGLVLVLRGYAALGFARLRGTATS